MADIPKTTAPGANGDAGAAIVWTAATTSDQEIAFDPNDLVLMWNTHASTGYTGTVYSAPAPETGRINDITADAIAAGAIHLFGPFPRAGWAQANGKLKVKANNAAVMIGVLKPRPT
jgi:hypothetical protein